MPVESTSSTSINRLIACGDSVSMRGSGLV
jgi:hypothetical protein